MLMTLEIIAMVKNANETNGEESKALILVMVVQNCLLNWIIQNHTNIFWGQYQVYKNLLH